MSINRNRTLLSLIISICLYGLSIPQTYANFYKPHGGYFKIGAFFTRIKANLDIKTNDKDTVLNENNFSINGGGSFSAIGYAFESTPVAVELDYIKPFNLNYDSKSIIVKPSPQQMNSNIKSQAILLNTYFYLPVEENFMPYINIGFGYGSNQTNTNITDTSPDHQTISPVTTKKKGLALQAGLGMRQQISRNITLDLSFEFTDFGKAQWGPWYYDSADRSVGFTTDHTTAGVILLTLTFYPGDQAGSPRLLPDND